MSACCGGAKAPAGASELERARGWKRVAVGAAIAGNAMLFSLVANVAELPSPLRDGLHVALALAALVTLRLVGGALVGALRASWRARRASFDVLFATGIAGALGVSLISTLRGEGPIYYEVAAILVVVHAAGDLVRSRWRSELVLAVAALEGASAPVEVRQPDGSFAMRAPDTLRAGDHVRIRPGRRVPVGGRVIAGRAFVEERATTGEPFASPRGPGDRVRSGAGVLDGTLELELEREPGIALAGMGRAVAEALERRAPLQHVADRIASWLLVAVAIVAPLTFAYWSRQGSWPDAVMPALSVLLVACPCAMGFATPLAFWSAIALLGARGVTVRSGEAVQRLAEIDHVAFDKTGTLTEVEAADVELAALPGVDSSWLRRAVAAVERCSDHPIARALAPLSAAPAILPEVDALRVHPGRGVEARVREPGSARWAHLELDGAGPSPASLEALRAQLDARAGGEGAHHVAILVDGAPAGLVRIDERLRPGLHEAAGELRELGIGVEVLTGDAPVRARRLGLAAFGARLRPEDKAARVEALRGAGRRVLVVGDGLNDALAMAGAHASLAMRGGAPIATEAADGVLDSADPRAVPHAIRVSRAAVSSVRASLLYALAYNAVGIGLAASDRLHPVAAALLMSASSLLVTWRAGASLEALAGDDAPSPRRAEPLGRAAIAAERGTRDTLRSR